MARTIAHDFGIDAFDSMYSDWTMLMSQPGPNFSEQRRVFRQALGPHVIGDYDALIQRHFDSFCGALAGVSGNPFPVIVEYVFPNLNGVIVLSPFPSQRRRCDRHETGIWG
jgi:cytochrome P450